MKASTILFLSNTAIMMSAIFIPVFAQGIGADTAEIGVIGFVYGASIFLSSYLFGRASDIRGRRGFLRAGLLLTALAFLFQSLAGSPLELALIRAFAGFCIGIYTAPLIAYAFEAGGRLGTFSSYGSLGWALGSILGGVIAQLGEGYWAGDPLAPYLGVFILSGLLYLVSFSISTSLPEVEMRPVTTPLFPRELLGRNLHIYVPLLLRVTGAFSIWIIFPLFLMELGASKMWIGIIYFANAGTQFFVMRRLDFANATRLYAGGLLFSAVVFFAYTLPGTFLYIIPLQFLLALTWSWMYVGGLRYLTENNEEKAASIGLMNSMMSISMGVGPLLGGFIAGGFGFHGVMYFASGLSLLGLLIFLATRPRA
ncbi:MAG: MFS transporter, partial [Euryarchaeota archaeon]|nr:MFS transporter [Euryarchaeota archaeon]